MQNKYKVSYGIARAFDTEESHSNTRHKFFSNKKQAEKYLKRLNKFSFQDPIFYELDFIAWTSLINNKNFNK